MRKSRLRLSRINSSQVSPTFCSTWDRVPVIARQIFPSKSPLFRVYIRRQATSYCLTKIITAVLNPTSLKATFMNCGISEHVRPFTIVSIIWSNIKRTLYYPFWVKPIKIWSKEIACNFSNEIFYHMFSLKYCFVGALDQQAVENESLLPWLIGTKDHICCP